MDPKFSTFWTNSGHLLVMYSRQNFPNQKPNEHVLMFLRRHWIVVFKIVLMNSFFAILPIIVYIILQGYTAVLEVEAYRAFLTILASAFYLFVILFAFANFVDYYLDVWIVTNERVINIEQKGLFSREISEKELGNMQDITSDVDGFWATILNYGNVYIQTAAEKERFVFKEIPFADEVARRISNLVAEYQKLNKTIEIDRM